MPVASPLLPQLIQLSFSNGMQSQLEPLAINQNGYRLGVNVINRGGVVSTRPGHDWKVTFPGRSDGWESKVQGMVHMKTFDNEDFLVVAVDGAIYYSKFPFTTWNVLPVTLSADVTDIHFAVCEQALDTNPDGSLKVITPKRVLIIQDGVGRPIVWDTVTAFSVNTIKQGTVMGWSGNRLWVADGAKLFASDIGDPTHFTETQYLGIGGSFLMPLPITAMSDSPDGQNLFVWTESTMHAVQSSIRDRTLWQSTTNFIQNLSTVLGCVSHRSVRQQFGTIWWMTRDGLSNIDTARNTQITSSLPVVDSEMAISRDGLWSNLSNSCIGTHGNFLLVSVPYGSVNNTHTWVMDGAAVASVSSPVANPVWASVWVGTTPVAWASGYIAGASRCFQLAKDENGMGVVWESFTGSIDDHGVPIEWMLETRGMGQDGFTPWRIEKADIRLGNIRGELDLSVFIAPAQHGIYFPILKHHATADVYPLTASSPTLTPDAPILGGKAAGQFRQLRTQSPSAMNVIPCDPQIPANYGKDQAFSMLVAGVGSATFTGFRVFGVMDAEPTSGTCADEGDGPVLRANPDGLAFAAGWIPLPTAVPTLFTSTQTSESFGGQATQTETAQTVVSQAAADRLALAKAESKAVTIFLSTDTSDDPPYAPKVRVQAPPPLQVLFP